MHATAQVANSIAPSTEVLDELRRLVAPLSNEQLAWSSGYLAGLAAKSRDGTAEQTAADGANTNDTWTVLYGSQTGNGRHVARSLQQRATAAGVSVDLVDMQDYRPAQLKREKRVLVVISTHGEGDPPDPAIDFYDYLLSDRAPKVADLQFSVLALGDSSYHDFCETGRRLDERLAELGGTRVCHRVDCDLDFEGLANDWTDRVVAHALENLATATAPTPLRAVPSAPIFDREHPYQAQVLVRQKITGSGSTKDVRHVELEIDEGALAFQPGDSLGVWPTNPPALVEQFIQRLDARDDAPVRIDPEELSLKDALLHRRDITRLSLPFLKAYVERSNSAELESLVDGDRDRLRRALDQLQIIDVIADHKCDVGAQWVVNALRPLTPRLYSIASSPLTIPDELHLTVANVNYHRFGRNHWGSASHYLSGDTATAEVFVEANEHFRLPENMSTPVIMIGAGTGIAPYRAFLQQRKALGADGENWLFFGDRHFATDFLYQIEWLRHRREGTLKRLDVAFSRDQSQKVYVQHRIAAQARDVFDWIEHGAHVYVCGDAKTLAPDVESALLAVIATQANLDDERAREYLADMRRSGRYQRDVY